MPHVYFLQPAELVGTDRYKVGMSGKNNLSRVKSYKSGTRYLCIMECADALKIEKKLLVLFKDKFTLIAGKEYFQIKNEADALLSFIQVITDHTCRLTNNQFESLEDDWDNIVLTELNPSYNHPEQLIDSADKHNSLLSTDALSYADDEIYNDKFRPSIEKNKWIYIDNQTLEWMGYHSDNESKLKRRYLNLLSTFQSGRDYKYINSSELNGISISICDIPDTINAHNKVKHLLVSPQCFRETLIMLRTNKASIVRKYYNTPKNHTESLLTDN